MLPVSRVLNWIQVGSTASIFRVRGHFETIALHVQGQSYHLYLVLISISTFVSLDLALELTMHLHDILQIFVSTVIATYQVKFQS